MTAAIVDILACAIAPLCALPLGALRKIGLGRLPLSRGALKLVGVLPIRHHYYDPVVYAEDLRQSLSAERALPGVDLKITDQLSLLSQFNYSAELQGIPEDDPGTGEFYYRNGTFEFGDAEILYSFIRFFKPARIIEIGSGFSTLMARKAIAANMVERPTYRCEQVCIEPFEHPWLESSGAAVIRQRVETCDQGLFRSLTTNDILFVDSSHVIRPQGDVLCEYLDILPSLAAGVLVHIHDVFTPRDYPSDWILNKQRLWNEQYLLEAFLAFNSRYRVMAALNHLWHNHRAALESVCPALTLRQGAEPGSFWMARC
jgi:hypothetical protein